MAGLQVFTNLAAALRAGYQVYDRTADGYLVRTRTPRGWAMALVRCRDADPLTEPMEPRNRPAEPSEWR